MDFAYESSTNLEKIHNFVNKYMFYNNLEMTLQYGCLRKFDYPLNNKRLKDIKQTTKILALQLPIFVVMMQFFLFAL